MMWLLPSAHPSHATGRMRPGTASTRECKVGQTMAGAVGQKQLAWAEFRFGRTPLARCIFVAAVESSSRPPPVF